MPLVCGDIHDGRGHREHHAGRQGNARRAPTLSDVWRDVSRRTQTARAFRPKPRQQQPSVLTPNDLRFQEAAETRDPTGSRLKQINRLQFTRAVRCSLEAETLTPHSSVDSLVVFPSLFSQTRCPKMATLASSRWRRLSSTSRPHVPQTRGLSCFHPLRPTRTHFSGHSLRRRQLFTRKSRDGCFGNPEHTHS